MTVFAEHFVLGEEQTLYGTHERTTLAGEVGSGLALESCLEKISGADADAKSDCTLKSTSGIILIYSIRRVETSPFEKHCAQRGA